MIVLRTQKELAQAVGVKPEHIRDVKVGRRNLSPKAKQKLYKFYEKKISVMQDVLLLNEVQAMSETMIVPKKFAAKAKVITSEEAEKSLQNTISQYGKGSN